MPKVSPVAAPAAGVPKVSPEEAVEGWAEGGAPKEKPPGVGGLAAEAEAAAVVADVPGWPRGAPKENPPTDGAGAGVAAADVAGTPKEKPVAGAGEGEAEGADPGVAPKDGALKLNPVAISAGVRRCVASAREWTTLLQRITLLVCVAVYDAR